MATRAIDEKNTDLALKMMARSQEFGGQLDAIDLDPLQAQRDLFILRSVNCPSLGHLAEEYAPHGNATVQRRVPEFLAIRVAPA